MSQDWGQCLRTDTTVVNSWSQKALKLPKGAEGVGGGDIWGAGA